MAFSLASRFAVKETMGMLENAAEISSALVADPVFFQEKMCSVLNMIADFYKVEGPSPQEARQIRESLKFKIHLDKGAGAYMQCAAGSGDIFINRTVSRLALV